MIRRCAASRWLAARRSAVTCQCVVIHSYSVDLGAKLSQSFVDVLVSPVNLFDVLNDTSSFCAEGCDQQGYAGPDIGTAHGDAPQLVCPAHTDDGCAVRIAEDDLGAHIDQLVDKEKTAFEHLLMNEHGPFGLCGYDKDDAEQVRGKPRPGIVVDGQHRTVEEGLDLIYILLGNIDIVSAKFELNAELSELVGDDP